MPLLVDSHEDLAWNMLSFGRDYTRSVEETRRFESNTSIPLHNGETLLGWPDYQRAQLAVIFSALHAAPVRKQLGDWETQLYSTFEQAQRLYRDQMTAYQVLLDEHPDKFTLIKAVSDLEAVLLNWEGTAEIHPVGLVLSMEGAEGILSLAELSEWWQLGLRIISPAWTGTRYCGGTREPGPLTPDGRDLLARMGELGYILDLSHMDEQAVLQSIDLYPCAVVVSHANAAVLLKDYTGNRLLSDLVIKLILERDGVIGVMPYCRFLRTGWDIPDGRAGLTLETVVEHIDHICQLAGNSRHVGIGSDFDGGFGLNAAPADVDTIVDLQKLEPILSKKGYSQAEIAAVFSGNWLRVLRQSLSS